MDNILFFCYAFLFIACGSNSRPVIWEESASIEENIASNAEYLTNDSVFPFLDDIIKKHDIIIIGEAHHYDTNVFKIKVNMIEYLLDKGINTMALEYGPFLSTYLWNDPNYNKVTNDWNVEYFWNYVWTSQPACQPILRMAKNRKIKIWGTDYFPGFYDIAAAEAILKRYKSPNSFKFNRWQKLHKIYINSFLVNMHKRFENIPDLDYIFMMESINTITNYTKYLISLHGKTTDLSAILQWIRNVDTAFAKTALESHTDTIHPSHRDIVQIRYRDLQWAENVKWWKDNYPNEKFSLWAANFHGAKDISQTVYKENDSLRFYRYQLMAEHLDYYFNDKVYSLAIVSHNADSLAAKTPYFQNTLEQTLYDESNHFSNSFIDFTSLRFHSGFVDKKFTTGLLFKSWNNYGNWMHIFDGAYYKFDKPTTN